MENIYHKPVLIKETLALMPEKAKLAVDATCGTGGHCVAIAMKFQILNSRLQIFCLDYDAKSLKIAKQRLKKFADKIIFIQDNFKNIKKILGDTKADFILADLGFSSWQLENNRGLAFSESQPLDMRLNTKHKTTASDLVNHLSEYDLAGLIYKNSGERFSRLISRAIVKARPIFNTQKLAQIIKSSIGNKYTKNIHPATLTFQALRIEVNQEFENLEKFLPNASKCLAKNGVLAIIAFHSLEFQRIKKYFKYLTKQKQFTLLTPRPIMPSRLEILKNSRSRSARLLAIKKL